MFPQPPNPLESFNQPYQLTEQDVLSGVSDLAKKWNVSEDALLAANPGMTALPPKGTMVVQPTPPAQEQSQGFLDTIRNFFNKTNNQEYNPNLVSPNLGTVPQIQEPTQPLIGPPRPGPTAEAAQRQQQQPQADISQGMLGLNEAERAQNQMVLRNARLNNLSDSYTAFEENFMLTGQPDYSLLPQKITIDLMMQAGLNYQDMQQMGYTYNGAGAWINPGAGQAGTSVSAINPGGAAVTTKSGRATYWKKKKNGKFERVRYRSRSERRRRDARTQRQYIQEAPVTQAANMAAQPVSVLELRLGSG